MVLRNLMIVVAEGATAGLAAACTSRRRVCARCLSNARDGRVRRFETLGESERGIHRERD